MNPKTKSVAIAAVVILALAVGAFIYLAPPAAAPGPDNGFNGSPSSTGGTTPNTPSATPPTSTAPAPSPTTPEPPAPSGITMAQVAAHATASSCWTVIRGNVYDLTTWIPNHPGGRQAILQLCGKDGTAEFTGQHGGSPQQENTLATFKIGALAE